MGEQRSVCGMNMDKAHFHLDLGDFKFIAVRDGGGI